MKTETIDKETKSTKYILESLNTHKIETAHNETTISNLLEKFCKLKIIHNLTVNLGPKNLTTTSSKRHPKPVALSNDKNKWIWHYNKQKKALNLKPDAELMNCNVPSILYNAFTV